MIAEHCVVMHTPSKQQASIAPYQVDSLSDTMYSLLPAEKSKQKNVVSQYFSGIFLTNFFVSEME